MWLKYVGVGGVRVGMVFFLFTSDSLKIKKAYLEGII